MKLSILIPAFNEKTTILELLAKVEAVDLSSLGVEKEIVIIDDFSTDGTREMIKDYPGEAVKIFHDKNYGKGHAIRSGIAQMTGDIAIIQDADLEYDPNDYYKLVKPIIDGEAAVVYGSRYLNKNQKGGAFYYFGGRMLSVMANLLYGLKITDEPTCYKVFKADLLKSIDLKCEKFEFCPEVTAKVARQGHKILEVPINYYPRSVDEGKKIKLHDGLEAIWVLIKYRFIK
ncbi:glycosyltransferase family 2 protein [Candidatus Falkowbacteria bacterium]|nr:glycosyltransferase family 2 protein [Candidatus Falkowbacteria bacterium]